MNYESGSVKNIHYGDIHTKYPSILSIENNKEVPFINNDLDLSKFSEDQYLQEGDLIIADASEDYEDIGKAIEVKNINNEKVLAGLHTILARDEKNMTVNGFKAYLFSTNNLKTKIKIIANGISVLGISKNNLSKINVKIPSKNEQRDIVSFISDIDKKIELLERKHQSYLEFKNYLMKQIFTQKLRFDFNDEWKNMKIGDCLDVKYGKDYKHLNEGKYPVLGTGGVMEYVDDFLYSGESILIGRKGTIDKPMYINGPFWTVDTLFYTEIKNQFPKFLFYCISNINWLKYNEASGVPSLSANNIKNVKISVPSLDEQKKISNLLTDVDNKIIMFKKEHNICSDFKKGLLQQMFVYFRMFILISVRISVASDIS